MRTFILAIAMAFSPQIACATAYQASGIVQKLFALDRSTYGADRDSVLIAGFSSAGTCPTNDGLVSLAIKDDEGGKRQFALLLAARLYGTVVKVRIDDGNKNVTGHCYLQILEID